MQNLAFKEDCLLRPTLDKTMRRIQLNCKIIPDLSELHNEPARLVEVITKLQITNNVQKEKLKDAQHLLHCLENDCEVCFPDEGVKYESDADDYFYDRDIADDCDIFESTDENDEDQDRNRLIPRHPQYSTPKSPSPWSVAVTRNHPLPGWKKC